MRSPNNIVRVHTTAAVLCSLLVVPLAWSFTATASYASHRRPVNVMGDTLIKDPSSIPWNEVLRLSGEEEGELKVYFADRSTARLSRTAYEEYARKKYPPPPDKYQVFEKMAIDPAFVGGEDAWKEYVKNNLQYTKQAKDKKAKGTIRVRFLVDIDGNVSDVQALDADGTGMEAEAVKLFKTIKWHPGIQNYRVIKGYKTQPVHFDTEQ